MKKLIVLATLAALPAVAVADVTISGNIGVAVSNVKKGDAGSFNDMSRHAGQIVFAGNEDLGNGIKAIWQVASTVDPTNDNVNPLGFNTRDTFIGVEGDFGRVRIGNVSNPVNSGYGSRADISYQIGSGSGISQSSGAARHKHSIRFDSKKVAGFEFAVAHQIKEAKDAEVKNAGGEVALKAETDPAYATDFGIKYSSDLFSATLTVDNRHNATVKGKTDRHTQLSAGTSFGDLGVYAAFAEKRTGLKKNSGFGISSTYKLNDKVSVLGTLWNERDSVTDGVKADDDFRALTVGVNYSLSKRTNAGFEFATQNETTSGKNDGRRTTAVYLFHRF